MDSLNINLLRTQSVLSQEELVLLGKFRFASIVVLCVVLFLGFFTGAAFVASGLQQDQLEKKRSALSNSIASQAKKQILLLSLQDRIPIIEKALDSQYPWDQVIENVTNIIAPPYLKTVTIGQNNGVNILAISDSLEEVESIITRALKQTQEKKIRSPVINSMAIGRDGKVDLDFTVVPIL